MESMRAATSKAAKALSLPAVGALLLAMLPVLAVLLLRGYSCGHDLPFHVGGWAAARAQLAQGIYPRWDDAAARGAGEPRFVFYPPLTWLLGAALRAVFSMPHAVDAFVLLALASCWLMVYLATRRLLPSAPARTLAATLYTLAPYTLFNAWERAAFGELLAAAWLPLLLAAMLAPRIRVRAVALPVTLLWLTNVPTAIIGCYLLLPLGLWRLWQAGTPPVDDATTPGLRGRSIVLPVGLGVVLGIAAAGFFLLPALHAQSTVQLNAAFEPGQRVADNFLLHHTAATRRGVIHVVSVITAQALALLLLATAVLWRRRTDRARAMLWLALGVGVVGMMLPWSAPLWASLPKLGVLQFPWRLLTVLTLVISIAVAQAVEIWLKSSGRGLLATAGCSALLVVYSAHIFWLAPDGLEQSGLRRDVQLRIVADRPTLEYTPVGAANDTLAWTTRQQWAARDAAAQPPDAIFAAEPTQASSVALAPVIATLEAAPNPRRWPVRLDTPALLVLRLRTDADWHFTRDGQPITPVARADGRAAFLLPAGVSTLRATWSEGPEMWLGLGCSLAALLLLWLLRRW
jgi:hypothetical protein